MHGVPWSPSRWPAHDAFRRSVNAADEVFDGSAEASGELGEDADAWVAFGSFDAADVGEGEAGGDRDLLLGQLVLGADRSDVRGQAFDGSLGRHCSVAASQGLEYERFGRAVRVHRTSHIAFGTGSLAGPNRTKIAYLDAARRAHNPMVAGPSPAW